MAGKDSSKYLDNIFLIFRSNAFRQVSFLFGVAASVAVGLYIYRNIQDPVYRPLDYKVNGRNGAVIAEILDKARIPYKIDDRDGIVMVPFKDVQIAKMKLAASGVQKDDSFSFSYLNDQNSIGESQFLENARYLRALEGDLSKTIISIDGVSYAKVHIAIPQNYTFADETGKPKASVFVAVGNGLTLDKEKVRSIIQIVASSVPGLDPKDVAITDQYGHYLSDTLNPDSIINAEQINYQNNIQSYYEKRIESLIAPLVGDNKVNVRVHAEIDFTQQEEAKEEYDPSQKVVRSEEIINEETGSTSAAGPAGSLANTPPTGGTGGGSSPQNASNQNRSQSIKNYELGKSVIYRKSNIAKVNGINVAVVVDNEKMIDPKTKKEVIKPLDKETLAKITDLVKATIGFNQKRGDTVTVVNSSFNITKVDQKIEAIKFYEEAWFWEIVKRILSVTFAGLVFFFLYRQVNKHLAGLKSGGTGGGGGGEYDDNNLSPEMQKLKQEQIDRLKEIASQDPNKVALVIKSWVAEK